MSGSPDEINKTGKAQKKSAKSHAKLQKKLAKQGDVLPVGSLGLSSECSTAPTPAERSAAAAEKQVGLQRYRVLFALLMFLLTLITFLYAMVYRNSATKSTLPSETSPTSKMP